MEKRKKVGRPNVRKPENPFTVHDGGHNDALCRQCPVLLGSCLFLSWRGRWPQPKLRDSAGRAQSAFSIQLSAVSF
jgi:hypothetical protein